MTDTEKAALEGRIDELCQENERLRKAKGTMRGDAFEIGAMLVKAREENAKLREQTELLVTLLRNDCDIEASWDGLRKFWYIGLTESGCLMRDRVRKAEAENAKLREFANEMFKEILLLPEYQMGSERKKHFIDKAIELGLKGYA